MDAALYRVRRLTVIFCLLAVLIAALTPLPFGLLFAILTPLWFFFAAIFAVQVRIAEPCHRVPQLSSLPVFSPRPPPAR
jgi:hypothetical protein